MLSAWALAGSCASVRPDFSLIARSPKTPSEPMPERITAIACSLHSSASERKKKSIGRRKPRGVIGSCRCSFPWRNDKSLFGGITNIWLGSTTNPSLASVTGMVVKRRSNSGRALACSGDKCWITTKAMPASAGTCVKNCSRASSPPAEQPMPAIAKPRWRGVIGLCALLVSHRARRAQGLRVFLHKPNPC